jgi:hypothetical protein
MGRFNEPLKRKWGRLDDNNQIVEFTKVDPLGRFHPDIKWVEVEWDTKLYTTITLFGSEVMHNPESIIGETDLEKMSREIEEQNKQALEELETKKDPVVSDYTANPLL